MSSHSGTIGRKRGGSGSGGSEYYFNGGEHAIRRQRSAEWHSRHAYNSSSEDEYQNTGQTSAFDTQLLAQLLLQSQQLASKSFWPFNPSPSTTTHHPSENQYYFVVLFSL